MIFFRSDYSQGAHPEVLAALSETNLEHADGYGLDKFCENAANLIKKQIQNEDADVHFFVGGTPANFTLITAALRPHEAVIAPKSGHIFVHETGAIEARGHKIIIRASDTGKLLPHHIEESLLEHEDEHMVKPKLVYISNSTETGTIYTKAELTELSKICRKNNLYLYMDGARLGSALTAKGNDLTLPEIASLVDAFYIGGTKNGALLGEALVIINPKLKPDFRFIMKQQSGLLAKGRILGVQFEALFKDGLYFRLAEHSNRLADKLRSGISEKGYSFLVDSPTNQVFPILPKVLVEKLEEKYFFYRWKTIDDENICIRLVTSWGLQEDGVLSFLDDI
jgi:threonine aldolase